ncbi:hypothetical protein SAMN05444392_11284 [Seinonella peptonophila]|uniref:Uncharacterized protein n=1 Tax=Seinonella peptonophila TaxID=112248 RepID=A0A1M5A8P0_9BACL|nr:hypothetical protein [Seinonella peptonophila]SHF26648.1 hypothetical protein SAMN05444392_11284 [Seinonella peptonophila]
MIDGTYTSFQARRLITILRNIWDNDSFIWEVHPKLNIKDLVLEANKRGKTGFIWLLVDDIKIAKERVINRGEFLSIKPDEIIPLMDIRADLEWHRFPKISSFRPLDWALVINTSKKMEVVAEFQHGKCTFLREGLSETLKERIIPSKPRKSPVKAALDNGVFRSEKDYYGIDGKRRRTPRLLNDVQGLIIPMPPNKHEKQRS